VLAAHLAARPEALLQWERDHKLKDDPRITRIGAWLRRTSLDELPQLINVLRGEMSLVGPRPVVAAELARYGDNIVYYVESTPGLTGLWQVSGRNDLDYRRRVHLDCWYVKNWSLWCDLIILLKTPRAVLHGNGAY
jgi:lipopolysaccharide/colanic/teichoic acid biosynthesis glycosyltransferase